MVISPSMFVFPDTYKTFEPYSSMYRFDPTSRVCIGLVFKIPTLASVKILPYT